ncbi:MAG: hypothetical protein K2X66_03835 [Cyanobacteria bacterium]|nr:hypothetical protein [Cyanobacteriota bacterium]
MMMKLLEKQMYQTTYPVIAQGLGGQELPELFLDANVFHRILEHLEKTPYGFTFWEFPKGSIRKSVDVNGQPVLDLLVYAPLFALDTSENTHQTLCERTLWRVYISFLGKMIAFEKLSPQGEVFVGGEGQEHLPTQLVKATETFLSQACSTLENPLELDNTVQSLEPLFEEHTYAFASSA